MSKKRRKKNTTPMRGKNEIHFELDASKGDNRIEFELHEDGEISIRKLHGSASLVRTRERLSQSRKKKLITAISLQGKKSYITVWQTIKANYDVIITIDSGRFHHMGYNLCIMAANYTVSSLRDTNVYTRDFNPQVYQVNGIHEELIGWHCLFHKSIPSIDAIKGMKICVITDHQQELHKELNQGTLSYLSNHKVPTNVDLIYAGDSGDHELNTAIKNRHNRCKLVAKAIQDANLVFDVDENLSVGSFKSLGSITVNDKN